MSDSNTSLDISNLVNLLQDKVYPVEGRQKKNELFKDFQQIVDSFQTSVTT